MSKRIVEAKGLSRSYRRDAVEITALDNIDLEISEGEFLGLMGPSGSGKTTLLNLIAGIDQPTSGALHVGGEDISHKSENELATWRNHHIGFIFQTFNLIPVLTAYENVEL